MAGLDIFSGASSGAGAGASFGPWGALAGGLIGAGASWWLGNQAEEAKRRAGLESIRRMDRAHAWTLSEATAGGAASGVEMGSTSLQTYLAEMSKEFRRQHDWAARQVNEGADIGEAANALGLASGIGSSLFNFGRANNWWQSQAR